MLDVKYANQLYIFFKDIVMTFIVTSGQGHVLCTIHSKYDQGKM